MKKKRIKNTLEGINSYKDLTELVQTMGYETLEIAYPILYEDCDKSTIKLGKLLDVSSSTAGFHLKKLGVELQKKGGNHKRALKLISNETIEEAVKKYGGQSKAAVVLGVSESLVCRAVSGNRPNPKNKTKPKEKKIHPCRAEGCSNYTSRKYLCDDCYENNPDYKYEACGF